MISNLVKWTNSWLLDPGVTDDCYPNDIDRAAVFMAVVTAIGSEDSQSNRRNIHQYFTYLLRGCNPVTADVKRSAFVRPENLEAEYFTPTFNERIKGLLDFTRQVRASDVYTLLTLHDRITRRKRETQVEYLEEQQTLLLLSLWLAARVVKPAIPRDPVAARACLSLYHKSRSTSVAQLLNYEYASNSTIAYSNWLNGLVDHILTTTSTLEELKTETAYLAWFACLIRAARMMTSSGLASRLQGENAPRRILDDQITLLTDYLNSRPPITDRLTSKRSLLNVLGIKPKKKAE